MAKKTTLLFMTKVNGQPARARPPITISAGMMKTLRLPMGQSEGTIGEVVLHQFSGTPVAVTVEVLDSKVPFFNSSDTAGEQPYTTPPAAFLELFRVMEPLEAGAGEMIKVRSESAGFPFINADQVSQTLNEPYLYLTIIPDNALDDTVWEMTITGTKDIS